MRFCCVKKGDKYGDEYVLRLRAGIQRNLKRLDEHEFVCLTDKPLDGIYCEPLTVDLPGWWSKLSVFNARQPLIYFDLDVVVTGDMTPLLEWDGFGIIKDWWLPGFNSSVMKLTGNEGHVWDDFIPEDMNRLTLGDQQWITEEMSGAATFPREWFPSYKAMKCQYGVPAGALAVIFHGLPKPCQIESGWVKELWV